MLSPKQRAEMSFLVHALFCFSPAFHPNSATQPPPRRQRFQARMPSSVYHRQVFHLPAAVQVAISAAQTPSPLHATKPRVRLRRSTARLPARYRSPTVTPCPVRHKQPDAVQRQQEPYSETREREKAARAGDRGLQRRRKEQR
jgi:hypothetical protein